MARLRNYFLTGLLVTGPAGITLYLTWWLVSWVDSWVKPYLPAIYNPDNYLPFRVPGYGLVVALLALTIIGFLTANFVGAAIVGLAETTLGRMPLVRNLYKGLKQIFSSVLAEKGDSFRQAVLVRFPHQDVWSIGFVTGDLKGEVAEKLEGGNDMLTVYVPTTPNPTGGYLLFVRRNDAIVLDMSVEDAAKFVISFGLVTAESAASAEDLVRNLIRREPNGASASGDHPETTGESGTEPHSVQDPS